MSARVARPVVIRLTRKLPLPIERAFAWLTDFQDDDPARAGALLTARKILSRSPERVVFEGEHDTLGRRMRYTQEVLLAPPDAWRSHVIDGPRQGSRNEYRLEAAPGGSVLRVEYRLLHDAPRTLLLMRVAKPLLKRKLAKMWEGYEKAMREDAQSVTQTGL